MSEELDFEEWEKDWKSNYEIEEKNVFAVSHPSEPQPKYFDTQEEAQGYIDYVCESIKELFERWSQNDP